MVQNLLTSCDDEPIHILSNIQSRFFLLTLAPDVFDVWQCSENIFELLGASPEQILMRPLERWMGGAYMDALGTTVERLRQERRIRDNFYIDGLFCVVHLQEQCIVVEIEQCGSSQMQTMRNDITLSTFMAEETTYMNLPHLLDHIASRVLEQTGYARVMIYQFDSDYNGTVVVEKTIRLKESFLHHRFPASDIPAQARALYLKNRFRVIEDVNAAAAALLPSTNPGTLAPLDMSHCYTRSVSSIHLEYLRNMKVGASMSLSLIVNERLWGLVVCHHDRPRRIPLKQFETWHQLSMLFSIQIAHKLELIHYEKLSYLKLRRELLIESLRRYQDLPFVEAFGKVFDLYRKTLDCDAALLWYRGHLLHDMSGWSDTSIHVLLETLTPHLHDRIYLSSTFGIDFPQFHDAATAIGGVATVELAAGQMRLLFLRFEQIDTIEWAGEPKKELVL
ncbi:MAG: GAF domain-containing protein [Campylobacterales bacterium]|nr:GAF domain-containing protein [Campylobacterales bacterium]